MKKSVETCSLIEQTRKEMSEIYRSFLEREKEKKEKFRALVSDFTNQVVELFKDDFVEVQKCG
jgi:predicted transcriptional regulator